MTNGGRRTGTLSIIGGTAVGQAVGLASSPLISRLFSPEEFGLLSVITAAAMVLVNLFTLRADLAVPLPKHEASAYSLVALGFITSAALASFLTIILALLRESLEAWTGFEGLSQVVWVAPVLALSMAWFQLLNALAVRQRHFAAIGQRNILQAVATALLQISAGIAGMEALGLVGASVLGQFVGVASLAFASHLTTPSSRLGFRSVGVRAEAKKFRTHLMSLTPAGVLNAMGLQLPVIMATTLYGLAAGGWFGMAQRVLSLPVALVGQAVAQVYLGELSKSHREANGGEAELFVTTTKRLLLIGVISSAGVFLLGPWAFEFAFGRSWVTSGILAQALSIALLAQFVASPVSQTLVVYNRPRLQLAWDLSRALGTNGVFIAAWAAGLSLERSVFAFACSSALFYAISWELSRRTVSRT